MEVIAGVIELKPDSLHKVDVWAETINRRIDEALATLRDEGVQLESWFHLSLGGKDYLLSYMRADSLERAHRAAETSPHAIDAYHQRFKKDARVGGTRARLLIDLVNDAK